jgi:uncharacterized protein YjbI with pentapeptide repeats
MKKQNLKTHTSDTFKNNRKKSIIFPDDRIYCNIDEAAKNCRKIYFIYLGILAYALLTAATISNEKLIFGAEVKLPFIASAVPSGLFFVLTPLMAIGLYIYIQLYLRKVNELINNSIEECKNKNKKCNRQSDSECNIYTICKGHQCRLYPWILIFKRWSQGVPGWAQENFAKFSLWWLLPIVLIVFSVGIIKKQEPYFSYGLLILTLLGSLFVILCWFNSQRNETNRHGSDKPEVKNIKIFTTEVSPEEKESLVKRYRPSIAKIHIAILAIYRSIQSIFHPVNHIFFHSNRQENQKRLFNFLKGIRKYSGCITLFFIVIVFAVCSYATIKRAHEGFLWSENGNWGEDKDLRTRLLRNLVFIDLSQKNLVKKQEDKLKLGMKYWLYLENVHLAGANLALTVLTKAYLKKTSLKNANLVEAQLNDAYLEQANLNSADLTKANLENASLVQAKMVDSKLFEANLKHATLTKANLDRANLSGANLSSAVISGSTLRRADLRLATLREVRCPGTDFQKADFEYADLLFADLSQAKEITSSQIRKAYNWKLALYSKEFCQDLGLPKDHILRVKERIFVDYDLKKAYLSGANLSGTNFLNVNLKEADLTNALLYAANLYKADLEKANLKGADLKKAQLVGANLREAKLQGADLHQTNFREADLLFADLRQAKNVVKDQIQQAMNWKFCFYSEDIIASLRLEPDHNKRIFEKDFADADCNYFHEADLGMADLSGANLRGADLQNIALHQTNLKGADLRNITYSNYVQFSNVATLYQAKLDEDLKRQLRDTYPGLFKKPVQ